MIVQYRRVADFHRVVFHGPGRLEIEQGDTESLSIEAPGDIIDKIESRTSDGTLKGTPQGTLNLGYRSGPVARLDVYRAPIHLKLVLKELNDLLITGSGSVDIKDLDTDQLRLNLMGNGKLMIHHLTADYLSTSIKSQGHARILGDVESQSILLSDRGRYEAEELVSDMADARMTGECTAEIRVTDQLTTYVGGNCSLGYVGYPEVVKQGAGTIVRRRKQQSQSNRGSEHG